MRYCAKQEKREWMGIEPTRRLFSRHNGFEARGGHQIRVHSPVVEVRGLKIDDSELWIDVPCQPAFNRHESFGPRQSLRALSCRIA